MKKSIAGVVASGAMLFGLMAAAQPPGGVLRLDSDGDGQVSRDEFRPPSRRGGPSMFERADGNGDGAVTRDELQTAIDAGRNEQEQKREYRLQMFDSMDADGNGVVEQSEAQDYVFNRADSNGDGFITDDEARAMHEQRDRRRTGGRQSERDSSQNPPQS